MKGIERIICTWTGAGLRTIHRYLFWPYLSKKLLQNIQIYPEISCQAYKLLSQSNIDQDHAGPDMTSAVEGYLKSPEKHIRSEDKVAGNNIISIMTHL